MKLTILALLLVLLLSSPSPAQTTAVDFTLNDCNGIPQNLYSMLDAGKVVVLIYEHECASCVTGALRVKNVINASYASYARIQILYLDNGGNSCKRTSDWIANNALLPGISFVYSNNGSSPYGAGMPVIVIAAGAQHKTYLVSKSLTTATESAIDAALRLALNETTTDVNATTNAARSFLLFPNPNSAGHFTIEYASEIQQEIDVNVLDSRGITIQSLPRMTVNEGINRWTTSLPVASKGIYFLRLTSKDRVMVKKLILE